MLWVAMCLVEMSQDMKLNQLCDGIVLVFHIATYWLPVADPSLPAIVAP